MMKAVSEPISTSQPTAGDLEDTRQLREFLAGRNAYLDDVETRKRELVARDLWMLCTEWYRKLAVAKGLSPADAGGRDINLYAYGSYRLGVNGPGSDMDMMCLGPREASRDDFFESMAFCLAHCPDAKEVVAVPEARVPVIKMKFRGVEVDLVYAMLGTTQRPGDVDLADDGIVDAMDVASTLSANGARVTDAIMSLVPNQATFCDALRFIKVQRHLGD
jgi:poly(A) polymerase